MLCRNCGANLKSTQPDCSYCGTRNSVDFMVISGTAAEIPQEKRTCPNCAVLLKTVDTGQGSPFYIEHCESCGGLFFDRGELHALLDEKVRGVMEISFEGLNRLISEPIESSSKIFYRSCPVCSELMNREKFGERSGVVISSCRSHGIWLESGELTRLLEWKREGGEILDAKRKYEEEQQKLRAERMNRAFSSSEYESSLFSLDKSFGNSGEAASTALELILEAASWFFDR